MTDSPTTYHHGNLREEILRVSVDILQEEGVGAITMRSIAERIGVSHSAAYRHFKGKDALLSAIAQQGYEQLTARLYAVYNSSELPIGETFRQMGVTYITYAIENPAQYRLMYGSDAVDRRSDPALATAARKLARAVLEMINLCQQRGSLKSENTRELSHAVWSLSHGAAMLVIDGHIRVSDTAAFADQMTAYLGGGISTVEEH
ncbi:MAG: TetR/AcrR family transcriptional regulator [Chloroflexota bacterium]